MELEVIGADVDTTVRANRWSGATNNSNCKRPFLRAVGAYRVQAAVVTSGVYSSIGADRWRGETRPAARRERPSLGALRSDGIQLGVGISRPDVDRTLVADRR